MARKAASQRLRGVDPAAPFHEDLDANWRVTYHFGRTQTGALAVERLEIAPRHLGTVPGDGLVSTLLGRVRIAAMRRRLRAVIDPAALSGSARLTITAKGVLTTAGDTRRRRGRPYLKRSMYLKIRDRYMDLTDRNDPDPHPAKTLAREFQLTREQLRCRLYRMRKMGLFNRTIQAGVAAWP